MNFSRTDIRLEQMPDVIIDLGEETKVLMAATSHYHEPVVAALYECGILFAPLYHTAPLDFSMIRGM